MTDGTRLLVIRAAGALMLLLGAVATLLPLMAHIGERVTIGGMLIAAGVIELTAVMARKDKRLFAGLAAAASLLAGLRLALDPDANFVTVLNLVILWLVVRAVALFFSARGSPGPMCNWIYMAAATDLLLALLLLAGLPVAVLTYGIFGKISQILGTFAWILAASFVATGLLIFVTAPVQVRELDQSSG